MPSYKNANVIQFFKAIEIEPSLHEMSSFQPMRWCSCGAVIPWRNWNFEMALRQAGRADPGTCHSRDIEEVRSSA